MNVSTRSTHFILLKSRIFERRSIGFNLRCVSISWNIQCFDIKIYVPSTSCLPIWNRLNHSLAPYLVIILIKDIVGIHHIKSSVYLLILGSTTISSLSNHRCRLVSGNILAGAFECIWTPRGWNLTAAIYEQSCIWWVDHNSLSKNLRSILKNDRRIYLL